MNDYIDDEGIILLKGMREAAAKGLLQILQMENKNDFILSMIPESIARIRKIDEMLKTRKYIKIF
jgi:predicted TIM-barrel enzyme